MGWCGGNSFFAEPVVAAIFEGALARCIQGILTVSSARVLCTVLFHLHLLAHIPQLIRNFAGWHGIVSTSALQNAVLSVVCKVVAALRRAPYHPDVAGILQQVWRWWWWLMGVVVAVLMV